MADGSLEIGTLIASIGVVNLVYEPFTELSELYSQVQSATAAMEKITAVLDTETDVETVATPAPIGRIDGRIDLDHVTFAYGEEPVVERSTSTCRRAAASPW